MDTNKLEAALRRLEDEQFGRTLNFSGKDAAVVGEWMRWLRELKPENLRRGEQPEPVRIVDAVPDGAKHGET
jgi:hypothetical protein